LATEVTIATRRELFRLFLTERKDPAPFYESLATRSIDEFRLPVDGRRVLDLGCGPGYYGRALQRAGATVVSVDLDADNLRANSALAPPRPLESDATRLPFPQATFDGVFCSNMLEHTPRPEGVIAEIARVLRPGGWGWVSWTNWYSPWGGHAITPLHYLGPRLGLRAWRTLFGEPKGKNLPYKSLWPTFVGRMIDLAGSQPGLRLVDVHPRYYPSQRWIVRVPGVREVATWNCVLVLERERTATSSSRVSAEPTGCS
jgi:SAM-dependent methyltransferase